MELGACNVTILPGCGGKTLLILEAYVEALGLRSAGARPPERGRPHVGHTQIKPGRLQCAWQTIRNSCIVNKYKHHIHLYIYTHILCKYLYIYMLYMYVYIYIHTYLYTREFASKKLSESKKRLPKLPQLAIFYSGLTGLIC